MADDGKEGLATAVETVGIGDPPDDESQQLDLIGPDDDGEALAFGQTMDGLERRRGPGRPAGSKNKRTEEWLEYLQSQYTSPLVALAKTWSADTEKLAAKLRTSREKAFEIQQSAARASLPYWHQKQPVAVEIDAKGHATIEMHVSPQLAAKVNAGAVGEGMIVIEGEIIDDDDDKENPDKSTG